MSEWLNAFEGIPAYPTVGGGPDLAEVLAPRVRRARGRDSGSIVHHAALEAIARRIEAQSVRIAELEGGVGSMIDQAAVDAWEAERAAMPTGVVAYDRASDEAVLYGADGNIAAADSCEAVRNFIEAMDWGVTVFDTPELFADQVPKTLVAFQAAFGAYLRAYRAAEIEKATGRIVDGSATLTLTEEA